MSPRSAVAQSSSIAAGTRAGAVSRLAASVVDALILAVSWRGSVWMLEATKEVLRRFAPPIDLAALVLAAVPLMTGLYYVGFWWAVGQTPGKWLLGVKVVPLGGSGRIGLWRSVLRLFGYLISALPCYLGFLWILGPQRRGWHDQFAGTEVVYVPRRRVSEPARITGINVAALPAQRPQPQA